MENKDRNKDRNKETNKKIEKMRYDLEDREKCKIIAKKLSEYIKNGN